MIDLCDFNTLALFVFLIAVQTRVRCPSQGGAFLVFWLVGTLKAHPPASHGEPDGRRALVLFCSATVAPLDCSMEAEALQRSTSTCMAAGRTRAARGHCPLGVLVAATHVLLCF